MPWRMLSFVLAPIFAALTVLTFWTLARQVHEPSPQVMVLAQRAHSEPRLYGLDADGVDLAFSVIEQCALYRNGAMSKATAELIVSRYAGKPGDLYVLAVDPFANDNGCFEGAARLASRSSSFATELTSILQKD